jgi:hypothetical protein
LGQRLLCTLLLLLLLLLPWLLLHRVGLLLSWVYPSHLTKLLLWFCLLLEHLLLLLQLPSAMFLDVAGSLQA